MKKILSLLLSVCLVLTMIPAISFAADGDQASGDGNVVPMGTQEEIVGEGSSGDPTDVEEPTVVEEPAAAEQDVNSDPEGEVPGEGGVVEEPAVVEGQQQVLNDDGVLNNWQQQSDGYWRYYVNGNYLTGMQVIGGSTYLFRSSDGYMQVGLQTNIVDNWKYYFNPSGSTPGAVGSNYGVLMTGLVSVPGVGTCFFNPEMKYGWQTVSGKKYYFGSTGAMLTGLQTIGGAKYFLNPEVKTGWQTIGGKRYFFNSTGAMQTGWATISGSRYYFNGSGLVTTGWATIGGSKYFFNGSGVMQTGWKTVKKNKYYLDPASGQMTKGWAKIGSKTYFFNTTTGAMKKGWLKYKKKKYYLNPKTGVMTTGLKTINKAKYFFNKNNGVMKRNGTQKISKKLYYFTSTGKMYVKKGWFKGADKKSRYCLGKGVLATGKKKIGSNWYIFSKSNGAVTKSLGDDTDQKVQSKSSATSYLIAVKRSSYQVRVYTGSKGNWTRVKTYKCAIGADATPTRTGTYTISGKGVKNKYTTPDGTQTRYWYWCYYTGTQGVHSGLYYDGGPNDGKDYDTRVGVKSTNGGIRVDYSNARWIYNNVPVNTTVVVY